MFEWVIREPIWFTVAGPMIGEFATRGAFAKLAQRVRVSRTELPVPLAK